MIGAINIAEYVLLNLVGEGTAAPNKDKIGLALAALAGFFLLCGSGFLVYGGFLTLETYYETHIAAYYTAGIVMLLCFLCLCGVYGIATYRKHRMRKIRRELTHEISAFIKQIDTDILSSDLIKDNPKTSMAYSALAGFVAGEKAL